ncbi:hypothetical protein PGB90_004177 [Kerria lacca]
MSCSECSNRKYQLIFIRSQKQKQIKSFEKRWNIPMRQSASLENFEIHRTVGRGAFGRVLYVLEKRRKVDYAMKVMRKEKIVRTGQIKRVILEKRILLAVVHPFLVNLRFVFKTNSNLFLVMPFIKGGEIYGYMRTFNMFSENQTRFYSGQIILALQYLHEMGILYRDLKPENILMECDGYIKITDFGFAKRLENKDKITMSFVGTPEYMAPEMLIRAKRLSGYSFSVDWWMLGVFIYESASGGLPFYGSSLLNLFNNIVKAEYTIPTHFSVAITDLIKNLFQVDVRSRIGSRKNGVEELKTHVWFENLNWQALLEKKLPTEFVPNCTNSDATSNFAYFEEEPFEESQTEEFVNEFKDF